MTASLRTENQLLQIRKLTEVSRAITYAVSLDELFQLTVDRAADLLAAKKSVLLVANDDGLLTLRASHSVDVTVAQGFRAPFTEVFLPHLAEFLGEDPESFLAVPLVVAGAVKGILVVIRPTPSTVIEHDEWLLSALADQAAVALEKTRLDQIGEFREQLIGIVGHDLRNPINTILMAARLLVYREGLGKVETELARKITRSAKLATGLIDQLLDLTKSRLGGGIPIEPAPFDMSEVCRQVIEETELTHPDRPVGLNITGDSRGVWDRDRMHQLLGNLIGNAVQHGEPQSSIAMRVKGGETEVVIEVENQGEPIPEPALPFIFDAFRQGRNVDRSRTPGLGLGLFIAQQIARSHGGSIAATSSQSDGTTFRVRVPRSAPLAKALD